MNRYGPLSLYVAMFFTESALGQAATSPSAAFIAVSDGPLCQIRNLQESRDDAVAMLVAECGKRGVFVGEAVSYTSSWNSAYASLLVVRQQPHRTSVSAVVLGADGLVWLKDLTLVLQRQLVEGGRIRAPTLSVDTGSFSKTGAISVAPVPNLAIKAKPSGVASMTMALVIDLTPLLMRARSPVIFDATPTATAPTSMPSLPAPARSP